MTYLQFNPSGFIKKNLFDLINKIQILIHNYKDKHFKRIIIKSKKKY